MDDYSDDSTKWGTEGNHMWRQLPTQLRELFKKWPKDLESDEITLEEWNQLNREIENGT